MYSDACGRSTPAQSLPAGAVALNDRILCKITLEPKHHLRVRDVLRDLNEQQLTATSLHDRNKPPLVGFSMLSSKVKLNFYRAGDTRASVDFSPDLARLLGFEPYKRYMCEGVTGKRTPNLMPNIRSVYVYCDILKHVPVGDTKAPLLRTVDKPSSLGGNVHRILNPTLYVPLQKRYFDTVEINMMTEPEWSCHLLTESRSSSWNFVESLTRFCQYKANVKVDWCHLSTER